LRCNFCCILEEISLLSPEPDLFVMTPKKIGRYEVKSELGRGGMATVYKAHDPLFEREVAVKVLPREMLHDPQFRVRFEREAKTVASLEHQAIVPVYDVGEEDGQPYFVMRYMTGGSLSERISSGSLSIAETAHIMNRLANALDEAHSKGVVHRDLKPGNIMFDHVGEPYVSDFGIAKIAEGKGVATITGGGIIGTPAYMSPEQAQGNKLDGRSDIYALGVIAFEMLTGRQPYEADTPMAVVVKHITDPIPHILDVNPNLPADLENVIESAMAKNPAERYATAREFAEALTAVSRGETPTLSLHTAPARPITRAEKTRLSVPEAEATRVAVQAELSRPRIPGWLLAGGVVGLLVCMLVVGGFFLLSSGILAAPEPTAPLAEPTPDETPLAPPTDIPSLEEPTATEDPSLVIVEDPPTPTASPEPTAQGIGGADLLAFVANNEIWFMNVDGSDLREMTSDGRPKTNLEWTPDGKTLVYISDLNIFLLDAETGRRDRLVGFPFATYLDAFRISPDGTQVAVSLNREMYVVPYDLEVIGQARGKQSFIDMQGCLSYTPATRAAVAARDFRWSEDGNALAWLYAGAAEGDSRRLDMVSVVDISTCRPETLQRINDFPRPFYDPIGYASTPVIPDYDWDGEFFFLFTTFVRNEGWGHLHAYNMELRRGSLINPIEEQCCYHSPRWSPDGNYVFFAFQDIRDGFNVQTQIYYIPYASIGTGTTYEPLPLPEGFFRSNREVPNAALRPVLQP
jgi:tRNA A-37 threonylcarbamoyl transferase component Bud32